MSQRLTFQAIELGAFRGLAKLEVLAIYANEAGIPCDKGQLSRWMNGRTACPHVGIASAMLAALDHEQRITYFKRLAGEWGVGVYDADAEELHADNALQQAATVQITAAELTTIVLQALADGSIDDLEREKIKNAASQCARVAMAVAQ